MKVDQPGLGVQQGSGFVGFDIDVAIYVAGKLGYSRDQITFMEAPSRLRESMLESGQVDLVVAAYQPSDARRQKVRFAGPYLVTGQDLLIRGQDSSISSIDALKGKKLCSVTGSTATTKITQQVEGVTLVDEPSCASCVEALAAGGVDAVTHDDAVLAGYAAESSHAGTFKLLGRPTSASTYAIGVAKTKPELCQAVAEALNSYMQSGSWTHDVTANLGSPGYDVAAAKPQMPASCD